MIESRDQHKDRGDGEKFKLILIMLFFSQLGFGKMEKKNEQFETSSTWLDI